jgi:hypothetical protein
MTRRRSIAARTRRRPLPLVAFIVAALAAFLMPAVRPDPVDAQATLNSQATLTVLTSPVDVQRASGNRDTASSGDTLVVGDRVFTGAGGSAKLTFFQGTEVDIAPETELMVQEMTQRVSGASTVSFGQAVGSTFSKVASLLNPASRVQVSTQSAVAVIRGTEVETTVTKEKVQVFRSNTGSFDVIAGGQVQRVKDGEVTVVPPPPPPPAPPTTRDTQTVGNATVSLPSGSDRPPLPPVPVAEIGRLFEKVAELTAKDGPPVVVTPPVAARDLIDLAQGKPVVLRPLGATPVPPPPAATAPPPPPTVAPVATRAPAPVAAATPEPPQSSNNNSAAPAATTTTACSTVISTATPTSSETRFKGVVVDGSATPIAGACVEAGNYTNTSRVSSVTDASGTFRIIIPTPATSGASSTYAIVAKLDGYTQAAIPTLTAVLGQTNNPFNLSLYRNNTTISGSIGSGTSSVPAAGAVASLVIEVPTPTSYTGDLLRIHVAEGTASSSGAYQINTVAANTFSYIVAQQKNVSPYGYRSAGAAVPSLSAGSPSTLDMILPTLNVTSPLTCEQYGAPCSATVSGTGWSSGQVLIGAKGSDGVRRTLGSVSVSSSSFTSQSLVSTDPTWPIGTYTLFASQGQGSTERYLEWGTSYVVTQGTSASCPAGDASGQPASTQVKFTGNVMNASGSSGVPYACVKVTRVVSGGGPQGSPGYAVTDASGAFAVLLDGVSGDYEIVPTKQGYTPQSVLVVPANAGVVTSLSSQNIRLSVNNATISGTIYSGTNSTTAAAGTKIGILMPVTVVTGASFSTPYSAKITNAVTDSGSTYSLGLASASSGIYEISVFQENIDGYSMRLYTRSLGAISGSITNGIVLPSLNANGSCPTSSQTCSVTISGAGWIASTPVEVNGAGSDQGAFILFGTITTDASGAISGSLQGTKPQVLGGYSIIAMQYGSNQEFIQVARGSGTYSVSSVRSQSVAAPASPTPLTTTVPAVSPTAVSTVVATPSNSTGTPVPTTTVVATVVPAATPTVSATPKP